MACVIVCPSASFVLIKGINSLSAPRLPVGNVRQTGFHIDGLPRSIRPGGPERGFCFAIQ